ncbi:alpha-2-macroglobulin family protein [Spirochaeta cellobiosiphila]|uniref:alpha-2-macroglobulin family protein n=1 Tax=Spirochaeta cellobiosiphila TaxID=504483 RepID=UPI0004240322|nr:MG2 domain-containing protein [Spirochaeta cellobiosiphila]
MKRFYLMTIVLALSLMACQQQAKVLIPADSNVVQAHTSGLIDRHSSVKVLFVDPVVEDDLIGQDIASPFEFSHNIKGEAKWTNNNLLEFIPKTELPIDETIQVKVSLNDLLPNKNIEDFSFNFHTILPTVELLSNRLETAEDSDDIMNYYGEYQFSEAQDINLLKRVTSLSNGIKDEQIIWTEEGNNKYRLMVSQLPKIESDQKVKLKLELKTLDIKENLQSEFTIPALGSFHVAQVSPIRQDSEYIQVEFTDSLNLEQNLEGLIKTGNETDNLRFEIDKNIVKVYSTTKFKGKVDLYLDKSIKNVSDNKLGHPQTRKVFFPREIPEVRFLGKGNILPTTQGATLPIETRNLNGVMIEVTHIPDHNILQFLQINDYNGDKELYRVGKVVWRDTIPLEWDSSKTDIWVRHGLNLEPLLRKYPAGMFRFRLTFTHDQVEYHDGSYTENPDRQENNNVFESDSGEAAETSYWDNWQPSYGSWRYRKYRKDPSHFAYYMKWGDHDITQSKNILISDIGVMAKQDFSGQYYISATDVKTAGPLPNTQLSFYDFQKNLLDQGTTDGNGFYLYKKDTLPRFLVAQNKNQKTYMKLDQNNKLSISHFPVEGVKNLEGFDGFIFGERGVWRPGDTIHLNFILVDYQKTLPSSHPVSLMVYNAQGKLAYRETQNKSTDGFYYFPFVTESNAPTGNWTAKIKVGNRSFEKILKVETVKPNRLKIDLNLEDSEKGLSGNTIRGQLHSEWLHGASAPNFEAEVKVSFVPTATRFTEYPEYTFEDASRSFKVEEQEFFEGNLDKEGNADIYKRIYLNGTAPGKLKASFQTQVFEPSGDFSTSYTSYDYWPYDEYVGIKTPKGDKARGMLLTDKEHPLDIVMVDSQGKPINQGQVKAELYKINWRWWWETGSEDLANYVSRNNLKPISSGYVKINNGKGSWNFEVKYPSWGRYMLRVTDTKGNHSASKIVYIDWPGWAGRAQKDGGSGASMLMMTTDQDKYNVGDTINLNIPTSHQGRVLVTLESKGAIISQEWIRPKKENTIYSFKAKSEMAPNIYAHVTYLQPHLQTANDLPLRLYGVVPIYVDNPASHLYPEILSTEVFKPESDVSITIKERTGKGMTYSLAVVDEGLLGLTAYKAPNPWGHFYQKQSSNLSTWDIYDYILNAYSGKLNTLLAIGGSDGIKKGGGSEVNRFKPVVKVFAPVTLGPGEQKTQTFKMPQYVGAVRIMVIAAKEQSFGVAEKSVKVKDDLMVLGTLPRTVGPEEEVEVPVTVFRMNDNIKDVSVALRVQGPAEIIGENRKSISFDHENDKSTSFKIRILNESGHITTTLLASSGSNTAINKTDVPIRIPAVTTTRTDTQLLQPNETWRREVNFFGYKGTNGIKLELSQMPPIDIERRLDYLIRYPHGCIEQTTSSVFPQVYLDKFVDLTPEKINQIQDNIKAGIERLGSFQTLEGGFSYWPGQSHVNNWGSNYAGHFLLEAKSRGYAIPTGLLQGWQAYQKKTANTWQGTSKGSIADQAYRLYTLALAGEGQIGAMNRLKEQDNLQGAALWRLASAYALIGQKRIASSMISNAGISIDDYVETSGTFGSKTRDEAMILESALLLDRNKESFNLAKTLANSLSSQDYMSTQTTSYALIAMAKYSLSQSENSPINAFYSYNNQSDQITTDKNIVMRDFSVNEDSKVVEIKNTGKNPLYLRLFTTGIPLKKEETPISKGLTMDVRYQDLNGRSVNPGVSFKGQDIKIKVTLRNRTRNKVEHLALTQLIPTSWEIYNERMSLGDGVKNSGYEYRDIRDDRVLTYFSLNANESKTFEVLVNNAYSGTYYLPMIKAEAMYDNSIEAVVPGYWLGRK